MKKTRAVPAHVISVCPSCGLFTGPHGTSEECIAALEAEVKRLTELAERFKSAANQNAAPRGKR